MLNLSPSHFMCLFHLDISETIDSKFLGLVQSWNYMILNKGSVVRHSKCALAATEASWTKHARDGRVATWEQSMHFH
jgi:hypothetical protein